MKAEVVLKLFGEYFFDFCKRSGYDHMLRTLGGNLFEFIENLDALHSYLALSYKVLLASLSSSSSSSSSSCGSIIGSNHVYSSVQKTTTNQKQHCFLAGNKRPVLSSGEGP